MKLRVATTIEIAGTERIECDQVFVDTFTALEERIGSEARKYIDDGYLIVVPAPVMPTQQMILRKYDDDRWNLWAGQVTIAYVNA